MPARLHHPASVRRLAGFVGLSFALHAASLVTFGPAGVASAPYRGPAQSEPLHATLVAAEPAPTSAGEGVSGSEPQAQADPRAGEPGGADVPFPDKWYTADELDVRAEPVGEVLMDYPEELDGSGIPGRVQLALYIDERGVVRRMRVVEAEPAKLFDKAATRAWDGIKFSPARKSGAAVKSQKVIEMTFTPTR